MRSSKVGAPHRRAPGHPEGVGDGGELAEELHGRRPAPDHEHPLGAQVLDARVVVGMELLPAEGGDARVVRDEGAGPRAGGVDQRARVPGPRARAHDQQLALAGDLVDSDGALDGELVGRLVLGEEAGHRVVGPVGRAPRRRPVGQVGHAVHVLHGQRVPPVLPRPARCVVGVQHDVVHAEPGQVERRGQAGLAGADDEGVEDVHARNNGRRGGSMPEVCESAGLAGGRTAGIAPLGAPRPRTRLRRRRRGAPRR